MDDYSAPFEMINGESCPECDGPLQRLALVDDRPADHIEVMFVLQCEDCLWEWKVLGAYPDPDDPEETEILIVELHAQASFVEVPRPDPVWLSEDER